MSYQVRFSDPTLQSITVEDQTVNIERSVQFVGKNYAGYSQIIAENFLHLLENFAKSSQPSNPVKGQLWYDTSVGVNNQLKLYDGTSWVAAGNVKKGDSAPTTSVIGDLWVDTDNQQLNLYNGSSWIAVGPEYSAGKITGAKVEPIESTIGGLDPVCLKLMVDDENVAIISQVDFTPKSIIEGFPVIKQGINLSTKNFNSSATGNKFWGTAEKAEALIIGSAAVAASNFLRSDSASTTNFGFNVRNNAGISIGGDLALSLSIDNNSAVIYNKISGSSIDFKVKTATANPVVLRVDSSERVGINNTAPDESLDVNGNIKTNNTLIVSGTDNATNLTNGSIRTAGGVSVTKTLRVGDGINVIGTTTLDNVVPRADSTYDLGTNDNRWKSIYADDITATNFTGNFFGSLTGNINGAATRLASNFNFSLTGDVLSTPVAFNGTAPVTMTTFISSDIITAKTQVTDSFTTDEFLINRGGSLRKIDKQTFLRNVPTIPTGTILPFAGPTVPTGYLLCDGSEVLIANYPELFAVIQYNYKALSLLSGVATFALPDLRGRFPLGKDNMSNSGAGISADRVTEVAADSLGGVGGASEVTLIRNNLPQHVHNLKGNAGTQFFAFRPATGSPPDTNAEGANGLVASGQGQLMVDSGEIFTDDLPSDDLSVPVTITNHYQTINYIIFTGRIA